MDGAYSFLLTSESQRKNNILRLSLVKRKKHSSCLEQHGWVNLTVFCSVTQPWGVPTSHSHNFSLFISKGFHWTGIAFPSRSRQSKACSLSLANQRNLLARLVTEEHSNVKF